MTTNDFLPRSAAPSKAPRSKQGRLGGMAILASLTLSLFSSACDDRLVQDESCPANPGVTLSATELTPGGQSAQELRSGLKTESAATMTLKRVHTVEDTQLPKHPRRGVGGVAFDLAGASSTVELSVEILPREEVLHFESVGVSCSANGCAEPYRCVERSTMAVDIHLRAKDNSFESVIPVDLVYYPKDQRDIYPLGGRAMELATQGEHAFYGVGKVDASNARGSLKIRNAKSYHGARILSSGFGVRVSIVDQEIVSLELTTHFELDPEGTESVTTGLSQPIYSSHR